MADDIKLISELLHEHPFEAGFVIGNGVSSGYYDTQKIRDAGGILIGCNLGYTKHPLHYVVWQDTTPNVSCMSFPGRKVTTDVMIRSYRKARKTGKLRDIYQILFTNKVGSKLKMKNGNTGYLAVQLAFIMGCNPIFLLGCDGCVYKDEKGRITSNVFRDKTNYNKGKDIMRVGDVLTVKHLSGFATSFTKYIRTISSRDFYKVGDFGLVECPVLDFPEFWSDKHPGRLGGNESSQAIEK